MMQKKKNLVQEVHPLSIIQNYCGVGDLSHESLLASIRAARAGTECREDPCSCPSAPQLPAESKSHHTIEKHSESMGRELCFCLGRVLCVILDCMKCSICSSLCTV